MDLGSRNAGGPSRFGVSNPAGLAAPKAVPSGESRASTIRSVRTGRAPGAEGRPDAHGQIDRPPETSRIAPAE
ncbi:hypothetical protein ASG48_09820 [Aurantimonas sp. Leaf443]|nr:hypothetical protein ASG48_09820 [Aurantimonas sp. Leaf443]